MKIDVLTLFPDMFTAFRNESIVGRAIRSDIVDINIVNIRDYSLDKHKKTDDYTFGGGPGMVLFPEPVFRAIDDLKTRDCNTKMIYMSPRGKILDKEKIEELAGMDRLMFLCGHYEGVDQRVIEYWDMEEISIGDYVLTGGELPAMVTIDAVVRFLPGVLGSEQSHDEESVYSGLLEYPHYSGTRNFRGMDVPEVLVSGHHENIRKWRLREALVLTMKNRPDLFEKYMNKAGNFSKSEKKYLNKLIDEGYIIWEKFKI